MSTCVATRENGLLRDHAITPGRDSSERVDSVVVFGGGALRGPAGSAVLLSLAPAAYQLLNGTEPGPAIQAGSVQAAAFSYGKGHVVILGDANDYVAAAVDPGTQEKVGLARTGIGNRQLVLNSLHLLTAALR
jgi:hypothetical protein